MRLDDASISFIYENVNALFPLNFIVSNYKNNNIKRLHAIDFPEHIKEAEITLAKKIVEQLMTKNQEEVYHIESDKKLKYMGMGVYEDGSYEGAILIGPYLNELIPSVLIEDAERFMYEDVPVLSRGQQKAVANILTTMMSCSQPVESTFLEQEASKVETSSLKYTLDDYQMNLVGIKEMYKVENKILYYVGQGNKEKALQLIGRDDYNRIEKINRFPDNPIRNIKNLSIVLNTLLRKTVGGTGVDEYFMHTISESFAVRIEKSMTIRELTTLMSDMVSEYCDLVNEYNTRVYSELIAKAITYIKLNFRKEIGLASIAKELFVHPTYLAKKFKQETQQTVSEYVNEVRLKEAQFMLKATEFKVEDIAYYVGYNDKKYFSKTFKKTLGSSPSEYRQYNKTESNH